MKPSDIKVGYTYVNRGAGRTRRTVLDISLHCNPKWLRSGEPVDEPGVRYEQDGKIGELSLRSFSSWAKWLDGSTPPQYLLVEQAEEREEAAYRALKMVSDKDLMAEVQRRRLVIPECNARGGA